MEPFICNEFCCICKEVYFVADKAPNKRLRSAQRGGRERENKGASYQPEKLFKTHAMQENDCAFNKVELKRNSELLHYGFSKIQQREAKPSRFLTFRGTQFMVHT